MSWTRLDDGWTDSQVFDGLPYDVRWHLLALIQFCSRTSRFDGLVRTSDARRCSDVQSPDDALASLVERGLVTRDTAGYRVVNIDNYVLPPHLRDEHRKEGQRVRQRRNRAHKAGNHTLCTDACPDVGRDLTRDVTRDTGTGRDGQSSPSPQSTVTAKTKPGWSDVVVAQPGQPALKAVSR
jgi:hypothetical protein